MSRERELAENTIIIAIGTFLPKLTGFINLPIITAGLTKAEYGIYDIVGTLTALLLPLATLQIQAAAFRFLIDYRDSKKKQQDIITNTFFFILVVTIITCDGLFICLLKIDYIIRIYICIYFFFTVILTTIQQFVRGLANNKLYSLSSIIQSFSNMLFCVVTVSIQGKGLEGVLFSLILATIISVFILLKQGRIYQYIKLKYISRETVKELIYYSWPLIPNKISFWVLDLSDRLVITNFLGIESNAIYAVANKFPTLYGSLQGVSTYAWQENASLASKDDDTDIYYSKMFGAFLDVNFTMLVALIAVTPLLFHFLIKGNYEMAYAQMPLLFLGVFFSAMASFFGGIYIAHKKTKSVGFTTMAAALINFLLDLLLIHHIGITAGAVSTFVSYGFLLIYRMVNVQKFQKISYNIQQFLKKIFLVSVVCILFYFNNVYCISINLFIAIIWIIKYMRKILCRRNSNV